MTWKIVNISNAGTSTKFGSDDMDKVSKLFSNQDVDDIVINADWWFKPNKCKFKNPADNATLTIINPAIVGDKSLNLPVITGTDTLMTLGLAQTVTGALTMSAAQKNDNYIDLKAISEPSSPSSGYIRLFIDTSDGRIKIKRSNGDVVGVE